MQNELFAGSCLLGGSFYTGKTERILPYRNEKSIKRYLAAWKAASPLSLQISDKLKENPAVMTLEVALIYYFLHDQMIKYFCVELISSSMYSGHGESLDDLVLHSCLISTN